MCSTLVCIQPVMGHHVQCLTTPGLHYKIPAFSDPAPGKSYATTYEQMGSRATQPLAKILRAGILLLRPGVILLLRLNTLLLLLLLVLSFYY